MAIEGIFVILIAGGIFVILKIEGIFVIFGPKGFLVIKYLNIIENYSYLFLIFLMENVNFY